MLVAKNSFRIYFDLNLDDESIEKDFIGNIRKDKFCLILKANAFNRKIREKLGI